MQDALNARLGDFNPRSPHGERRCKFIKSESITYISIHAPRTGSDVSFISLNKTNFHFNPRSPHGERHDIVKVPHCSLYISIHAPRTGSDQQQLIICLNDREFQSTLPARGATGDAGRNQTAKRRISIHAPRTGSDGSAPQPRNKQRISIHAPRTGSDCISSFASSTSSQISIHAPRTGSDFINKE